MIGMRYLIAGVALLCFTSACEQPEETPKRVLPKVVLPATPPLNIPSPEAMDPDGSYTVAGLLGTSVKGFERGVRVTGKVLEKHSCSDAKVGDLCPPAYLVLVDSLDAPGTQLLVVAPQEFIDQVEEGSSEVVSGVFRQWTLDKWFVRSEGLVEVTPVEE